MHFLIKLTLSILVIVMASQLGRRLPTLGGLLATMPLTSLIVLMWLYADRPDDKAFMIEYLKGVLWGILPSIGFFAAALVCLNREWPLAHALGAGFVVWLVGALIHQGILR